jgi:hypothetical protein
MAARRGGVPTIRDDEDDPLRHSQKTGRKMIESVPRLIKLPISLYDLLELPALTVC